MYWTISSTPFSLPSGAPRLPLGENIQLELAPVVVLLSNLYSLIILGGVIMLISLVFLRRKSKKALFVHELVFENPINGWRGGFGSFGLSVLTDVF